MGLCERAAVSVEVELVPCCTRGDWVRLFEASRELDFVLEGLFVGNEAALLARGVVQAAVGPLLGGLRCECSDRCRFVFAGGAEV